MNILLLGATFCITALIVSAWIMTFARWFPIEGIDGKFLVDYKTMIRAHIDYALMALFNLGFYGIGCQTALKIFQQRASNSFQLTYRVIGFPPPFSGV
jgi:hypothetical protein